MRHQRAPPVLTRRSLLPSSLGLAAGGALARPYIANAAATTATIWWVQGFAHEEDIAFDELVSDYEKASGTTIEPTIIPYAPMRQKIVSAITSGAVPDISRTPRRKSSRCGLGGTSSSMSATSSRPR